MTETAVAEKRVAPPPGLTRRLAELQQRVNEEMSALSPEQRSKRAKENLRHMPSQSYLFRDG